MSSRVRHRPSPPSRAKRNIRWAAIALLALSLAPAASPERAATEPDPSIAADAAPVDELPFIASEGSGHDALDLGADTIPTE